MKHTLPLTFLAISMTCLGQSASHPSSGQLKPSEWFRTTEQPRSAQKKPKAYRNINAVMLPLKYQHVGSSDPDSPNFMFGGGFMQSIATPKEMTPEGKFVQAIINGDVETVNAMLNDGFNIDSVILFCNGNKPQTFPISEWTPPFSARALPSVPVSRNGSYDIRPFPFLNRTPVYVMGPQEGPCELYGTPLMVAARIGNARMVSLLLSRGANPNVFIETKFAFANQANACPYPFSMRNQIYALKEAYWPALDMMIKQYDQTVINNAFSRCDRIARMLVDAGAMLAPDDRAGRTALYDAFETWSVFLLELGLKSGLDPLAEDNTGKNFVDFLMDMSACNKDTDILIKPFLNTLQRNGVALPTHAGQLASPDNADNADDDPSFRPVEIKR